MFQIRNYELINYRRMNRNLSTHKLLPENEFEDFKEEEENENGPIRNDPEDSNGSDENLENPVFMNNNQNFQYQRPPGSPSQEKRGRARQDRDNQTIKRK
jgi:hypothetical protein